MSLLKKAMPKLSSALLIMTAAYVHAAPESGWWWNEAEGGRGYTIEVQNGVMFMSGYMYDDSGKPVWYVSGPTAMQNSTTYKGTWLQYGGGQTLNGPYRSPTVTNSNVGNVTVTFSSATTATMTLPSGVTIPLTRYSFGGTTPTGPVAAICTTANINTQRYNAIAIGMTPDQVNATLGCKYDTSRTQRNNLFTTYVWPVPGTFTYLGVYFDTAGTKVIDIYNGAPGTTPSYKFSNGF